ACPPQGIEVGQEGLRHGPILTPGARSAPSSPRAIRAGYAWSAAALAHRPVGPDEVDLADAVPRPLPGHGVGHDPGQLVVAGPRAQQAPQVVLVGGEEAGPELAVGREADPV